MHRQTVARAWELIGGSKYRQCSPEITLRRLANLWSLYRDEDFSAADVAFMLCMIDYAIKPRGLTQDNLIALLTQNWTQDRKTQDF